MSPDEVWSVVSSVVSVILAVFSMGMAIYFFVQAKSSEQSVTNSLAKIEAQAESLQKLSAKWLDRLTRYVTEDHPRPADESLPQLIAVLAQLPQTITMQLTQHPQRDSQEKLLEELTSSYIAIYYYTALTNFWTQSYLPNAREFDSENEIHVLVRRLVDGSHADFVHMTGVLAGLDQSRIHANTLQNLVSETQEFWRHHVRSTADVFVQKEQDQKS